MDASDIIRKRKQQAVFTNKQSIFVSQNPTGDCGNIANCPCVATTNCIRKFSSYDEKYTFYKGRNNCTPGAVQIGDSEFGKPECLMPATGGSK